jgi:benzoate membrane transport protein
MTHNESTIKGLFNLSRFSAGFVAVLVGYTSSVAIIFQALAVLGATPEEINSWLWALGIGMGLTCIGLSLAFKSPVITAWSTPGAALLVTGLEGIPMSEAIGVFIFASALIFLSGVTGWFDRLIRLVPASLSAAMLAGVLVPFGLNLFTSLQSDLALVASMIAAYLIMKRVLPRYAIPMTFLIGIVVAALQQEINLTGLSFEWTQPVWTTPEFHWSSLIGVGLPLFIVTMTSQMVPGLAVMRANDYQTPASPLMTWTGLTGIVLAPLGGFSYNLAAITAAICMGEEADPDKSKRYIASIWAGIFYLLTGLFGATVAALFAAFPTALVMAIAGLALLGTIGNALANSLNQVDEREAALITFMVTASGISLLGIGSAFWGIVLGLIAYHSRKK